MPAERGPAAQAAREWLARADHDLRVGERIQDDPELADAVAFHAQQATEKCFKAFLVWKGVPFRKTHDLEELARECSTVSHNFERLRPTAGGLTVYAVAGRYPDDLVQPTQAEAIAALAFAREVQAFVLAHLPPKARP